jgi:hypothetical protein
MHHIILLFTARAWVPVSLSVNAGQKARVGLSASEPLSTPSVQHIYAVGPRSPFGLYAVCLARPGPAHFGSSANPPRALLSIPHCLSRRLRQPTARCSMYAVLPRRGPRGPSCGTSYIERLRLRLGLFIYLITQADVKET